MVSKNISADYDTISTPESSLWLNIYFWKMYFKGCDIALLHCEISVYTLETGRKEDKSNWCISDLELYLQLIIQCRNPESSYFAFLHNAKIYAEKHLEVKSNKKQFKKIKMATWVMFKFSTFIDSKGVNRKIPSSLAHTTETRHLQTSFKET